MAVLMAVVAVATAMVAALAEECTHSPAARWNHVPLRRGHHEGRWVKLLHWGSSASDGFIMGILGDST